MAAVAFGKGLSNRRPPGPGGPMGAGQPGGSGMLQGAGSMQQGQMSMGPNQQQHMTGVPMAQGGQPGIGLLWSISSVFSHIFLFFFDSLTLYTFLLLFR